MIPGGWLPGDGMGRKEAPTAVTAVSPSDGARAGGRSTGQDGAASPAAEPSLPREPRSEERDAGHGGPEALCRPPPPSPDKKEKLRLTREKGASGQRSPSREGGSAGRPRDCNNQAGSHRRARPRPHTRLAARWARVRGTVRAATPLCPASAPERKQSREAAPRTAWVLAPSFPSPCRLCRGGALPPCPSPVAVVARVFGRFSSAAPLRSTSERACLHPLGVRVCLR